MALGLSTISCPVAATQLHMGKGGKAKGKGKADGKGGGKGKGNLADQHRSLSCAAIKLLMLKAHLQQNSAVAKLDTLKQCSLCLW